MSQTICRLTRISRAFTGFALSGLLLAACQTPRPQTPSTPVEGTQTAPTVDVAEKLAAKANVPCPEFARGPGKFDPPFPTACAGLQKSDDGLRWFELAAGPDDRASPLEGATVIVAYEGYLASNGAKFDSSYDRGEAAVFVIDQVIQGWTEALGKMTPGDEWMVYIPAELAYGNSSPSAAIPPGSDLVFKIRLDGFLNAKEVADLPPTQAGVPQSVWDSFLPWDPAREGVRVEPSGLSYAVLEAGDPSAPPVYADDTVAIDYEARLAKSGKLVSSTWTRKSPLVVRAGDMIPGFAQMISMMKPGATWIGRLPPAIAYGSTGLGDVIPPNSDLIYVVNLIAVNPETAN